MPIKIKNIICYIKNVPISIIRSFLQVLNKIKSLLLLNLVRLNKNYLFAKIKIPVIFNTCLSLGIILLIYFSFYKLAFMGFGYLLIKNNSFLEEKFDDYLVQKDRFNKYYKKRFPILFYVLPIIGILSGLGTFYTAYLLNNLHQEILLEKIHYLSCKQELQDLNCLFTVFSIIFFSYIFLDGGIAIYVIYKANAPISRGWRHIMTAGRVIGGTLMTGSVTTAAAVAVAESPGPSPASNFIHTKTLLGRGWDAEPGDYCSKGAFSKLQQFTGNKLLITKLDELNPGTDKRIVNRETYQILIQDPEIRNKVENATNITDEELYALGLKTLPEALSSTTKKYVASGFSSFGEAISNKFKSIGTTLKSGVELLKGSETPDMSEVFPNNSTNHNDLEQDLEMSDEEFEERQANVPENSPGKKAIKDQDLIDARRRGLGKGKK